MKSLLPRTIAACSLLASVSLAQTPPPRVQMCPPTQSIPLQFTNWASSVSFPRFDPNTGILVGVQVTLSSDVEVSAQYESLDAAPALVTLVRSADLFVFRPGAPTPPALVTVSPSNSIQQQASAFDGVLDFRGTSGGMIPPTTFSDVSTVNLPPPASDLALFTGPAGNPGIITLPVTAQGASQAFGPGNIASQFTTRAGVNVQVCYLYYPDCNNNGIADYIEIQGNPNLDRYGPGTCAPDGILDVCQPEPDCDLDGLPDRCELVGNDCDGNQVPDNCQPDCDGDGVADACELINGTAVDRYGVTTCVPDGIPDNCQPAADCDNDGLPDRCELVGNDCDNNQLPDNCQADCDGDGIADACELINGTAVDRYGVATCTPDGIPDNCQPAADCDGDGLPDRCELVGNDCDNNQFRTTASRTATSTGSRTRAS
ncbi:MAG: choice-of-anchor E domain-containing protein [Phycisphaerales bacterium]|nr:choice-of-anchor E domain-containing protein [Phycisphaerales bacterium]